MDESILMKQLSAKTFSEWVLTNLKNNISTKERRNPQRGGAYKVLEIDSQIGASISSMRKKGIRAWGFENSETFLSQIPEHRLAYIQKASLQNFHNHIKILYDAPYDAIVSNNVLHLNPDDLIIETLIQSANLSTWQFHVIEEQYKYPLTWWQNLSKKLGVRAVFYAFTR